MHKKGTPREKERERSVAKNRNRKDLRKASHLQIFKRNQTFTQLTNEIKPKQKTNALNFKRNNNNTKQQLPKKEPNKRFGAKL